MNEMKLHRELFKPTHKNRPLLAILGTAASVHPWTSLLESFGDRAIHFILPETQLRVVTKLMFRYDPQLDLIMHY
jgi:hypothetical protein